MTERADRVGALLQAELSDLIRRRVRDPRVEGIVTVTHVRVSPDLRDAVAYISVLGSDDERLGTMQALDHARSFLRRELGKRVSLRSTPDLRFVQDDSIEKAQELTELMRKNAAQRGESI